jgi:peptide/nickel transport system permease protein
MRNPFFVVPFLMLLVVVLAVAFAGFVGPYDPAVQDRAIPFAPPTRLHIFDSKGQIHLRPFVYALKQDVRVNEYSEDRSRVFPVHFFADGNPFKVAGVFRTRLHLVVVDSPGKLLLLGTDGFGRDQFSRMLQGGQVSLFAGLLATTLALLLGLFAGTVAGYYGRRVDDVLMRTSEFFVALPRLYLLLAIRAMLPLHLDPRITFLLIVGIIGAVGWARPARLVRGIVLSAKERNFVLIARGFGASDLYLLRRHIVPETYPVLLTQAALLFPQFVLAEVTLSFLGLGVSEPVASWGNMLAWLQHYNVLVSYWWMLAPGLMLVPLFFACQRLADSIQVRLQPAN